MSGLTFALTLAALLGSAVMAGVFYAFSSFVMDGLGRLPAADGTRAMQSINIAVLTPSFLLVFLGTAALAAGAAASALADGQAGGTTALLGAAAALYLIGVTGLTMAYLQPRNLSLGALDPDADATAPLWRAYLRDWTRMNHVRTALPLAATALFAIALTTL